MKKIISEDDRSKIGIYAITNLVNNKKYIGRVHSSFNARWNGHIRALKRNEHKNDYLQKAWNKYGEHNFKVEVLESVEKKEENYNLVCQLETHYMHKYKTLDRRYGYNIMEQNGSFIIHAQETKDKMSKKRKEYNEKMFKIYGKGVSPETSIKLSNAGQGRIFTNEHKQNLSISVSKGKTGTKLSEEHKKNISKATAGENNPRYGKKKSEEERKKLSESQKAIAHIHSERKKEWWTLENKIMMSHKNGIMLEKEDYYELKKLIVEYNDKMLVKEMANQLSEKFNVSYNLILSVRAGKHWSNEYLLNGGYKNWVKEQ